MKLLVLGCYLFAMLSVVPTCGKKEVDCEDQSFTFATVGYTYQQMTGAVVRWYTHGSAFTDPVDTFQFYFNPHRYTQMGDTLRFNDFGIGGATQPLLPFTWRYDYEVYFASVNKTYRIYSLRNEGNFTGKISAGTSRGCTNHLTSYEVDGQVHQFAPHNPAYIVNAAEIYLMK